MSDKTARLQITSLELPHVAATAHNQSGSLGGRKDLILSLLLIYAAIIAASLPFFHDSENPTMPLILIVIAGLMLSLIVAPLLVTVVRKVRRSIGRRSKLEIAVHQGSMRGQQQLVIGARSVTAGELESIALLGWQEETGEDRVWDLTALLKTGETVDIVSAYHGEDEIRRLGEALASALDVSLRESSVVGGQVTQHQPKNIVRRPEL